MTFKKQINHNQWLCRLFFFCSVFLIGLLQTTQAQNDHFNTTDQGFLTSATAKNNPSSSQVYNQHWTTSQVITIDQKNIQGAAAPLKVTLEQVRNGSGAAPLTTGAWANGNLNASQAHYAEKWSIPYRLVISGLTVGSSNTAVIEWDIRQGGKSALDYITHYNNLDNPLGSHLSTFGHAPETIDPKAGVAGPGLGEPQTFPIMPPTSVNSPVLDQPTASFNSLINGNSQLGLMSIWKGTINSMIYGPQGDLNAAASTQQLTIVFTANASTVVIAWGGHIASEADWGTDNSASAISGSPYHTRLISFNGSGGNQDRSLSADAVIDPPDCSLTGDNAVECNTQNEYENLNEIPAGYTYTWSLSNNTSGASIVGAGADGKLSGVNPISVNAGTTACNGKGYTVNFTIYKNGAQIGAPCTLEVSVSDDTDPTASNPDPINVQCIDDVPDPDITVVDDEADNCSTPTVAWVNDVSDNGTCPEIITRTYSVTDACGNSINVTQTITVNDDTDPTASNPDGINVQYKGDVPAPNISVVDDEADNCSTPTVAWVNDVSDNGTCPEIITRTYSVTDDCGNSINVTQTITVNDDTDPTASNPDGINVQCKGDVPAPDISVVDDEADNCSTPTVAWVNDVSDNGTCPEVITRTYSVTDACGNSINVTQTITVSDDTDPTASNPDPINVQCFDDIPDPDISVVDDEADNCSTPTVAWVSDVSDNNTCAEVITRTYSVTDACGNSINVTQTITVNDDIDPTASNLDPINVQCIDDIPDPDITLVDDEADNCSTPTVAWVSDVSDNNTCPEVITRTYSVTDDCGNSINVTQTITVNDDTPPVITNCPPDLIIEFGSSSEPTAEGAGIVTATDNCSTPVVDSDDVSNTVGCQTIITRTWTVTDDCGNTATCVQHIIIRDRTAPEITCPVDDGPATATDNFSAEGNITIFYRDAGDVRTWTAIDESGNTATCQQQLISLQANNSNLGGQHLSNIMVTENNNVTVAKNNVTKMQAIQNPEDLKVTTFPNPFSDRIRFVVNTTEAGTGSLEVHNMLGQKVKTVFQGRFNAGTQSFELQLPNSQQSTLIYVLRLNGKQVSGKMLQVKD